MRGGGVKALVLTAVLGLMLAGCPRPRGSLAETHGDSSGTIGTRGLLAAGLVAAANKPSMECRTGTVAIRLGELIPITSLLSNPTDKTVTLTISLADSPFLGPARPVASIRLGAYQGRRTSGPIGLLTTLETPLGTGHVAFELRSDRTGAEVLTRCEVDLTTGRPDEMPDLIQVPVRWCVLEGSAAAGGKPPGSLVEAGTLPDRLRVTNGIWAKGAHLVFTPPGGRWVPVSAHRTRSPGVPLGVFSSDFPDDATEEGDACREAYEAAFPGLTVGVPLILARSVSPGWATAPGRNIALSRNNDICVVPRNLQPGDVAGQTVIIASETTGFGPSAFINALAHELGHVLLLEHGNGLDDDGNGVAPPATGPRLFDGGCDPAGWAPNERDVPKEDLATNRACEDGNSIMYYMLVSCMVIRPLQAELARDAARLVPGVRAPPLRIRRLLRPPGTKK